MWGTQFSNLSVKRDLKASFSDAVSPTSKKRRTANELLLYEHNYCGMMPLLLDEGDPNNMHNSNTTHVNNVIPKTDSILYEKKPTLVNHSKTLSSILKTSTCDKVEFCDDASVQHDLEVSFTNVVSSTPKKKTNFKRMRFNVI